MIVRGTKMDKAYRDIHETAGDDAARAGDYGRASAQYSMAATAYGLAATRDNFDIIRWRLRACATKRAAALARIDAERKSYNRACILRGEG